MFLLMSLSLFKTLFFERGLYLGTHTKPETINSSKALAKHYRYNTNRNTAPDVLNTEQLCRIPVERRV